ncbi:MAG: ABC transporter permease subunit [Oscillospiraceae bacterium]|nr:ABC transporter permease subunit [Oscillospiraceae bacterium]
MKIIMTEKARNWAVLVIILRVFILWVCLAAFLPILNPARVSELISENYSLFTCAVSPSATSSHFERALLPRNAHWGLEQSTVSIIYNGAFVAGLAIIGLGTAACFSLGNIKMRRFGAMISAGSAVLGIAGVTILRSTYGILASINEPERVRPMIPGGITAFYIMFVLVIILSAAVFLVLPKPEKGTRMAMDAKYRLFLMMLPFLVLVALFAYLPLFGWRYAFQSPVELENSDPFYWFKFLFTNRGVRMDIPRVMTNTFAMSGIGIATAWLPMVFAVFLAEMKANRPRHVVQTLTTIPNFISWILVYSVAFAIFSTEGFFNWMLANIGVIESLPGPAHLMDSRHIWLKMWLWGTWKGLGWSAIIYIAGISSIDPQLYEAATVDGAGRFRRMWHITIPGLLSTFFVLLLLSIANILSNGMEQYFVFENHMNRGTIEVLDLYIYNTGIGSNSPNIPLATIVGMFKTIISVTLLFTANRVSKWLRGETIV